MGDGEPYPSGTVYEVLSAVEAAKNHGFPDVYVFRYPHPPTVQLDDPSRFEIEAQWERLKGFFGTWFRTTEGRYKAAFQTFASTDDFEAQTEALLRKWLQAKLQGRSVVWPIDIKGSPFPGLAAFGAKHAPVFFGRSRDITKAVDRLKDAAEKGCPFLVVVGGSGAGKSSLVRAGIVPRLTAAGVVPSIELWRVAVMRPGEVSGNPFAALAAALFVRSEDLPEEERGRLSALPELSVSDLARPQNLALQLSHADDTALTPLIGTLIEIARAARDAGGYGREVNAALLLVVDQFDELFGAGIAEEVRTRFAQLLGLLARSKGVWIIATLRADLYDQFVSEPELKQLKEDGASYDLVAPDAAELAEIVRGPARAADLVYELDYATREQLDERLLKDAGRSDLLPLLEFTLNRLFEVAKVSGHPKLLTFAAYCALGGLEGAVDKEAEAALKTLGEAEQARLPRLLRELAVQAREAGITATRAAFEIRGVPLTEAAFDETSAKLVRAPVDARILVASGEGKEVTVRMAHARVLDSWQRAKAIVTQNADFYRIRADIEEQRRKWEEAKRSRDLLIGRGLPLAEANSIVRRFPEEIPGAMRDFIKRSNRRARRAQTLRAAIAVLFALVAAAAVYLGLLAVNLQLVAVFEDFDTLGCNVATPAGVQRCADHIRKYAVALGSPDGLNKLGDLQLENGDIAGAVRTYRSMAEVVADSRRPDWQRSLSVSYEKMGDAQVALGNLHDALSSYFESVAIRHSWATGDPSRDTDRWRHDLALIYSKVAEAFRLSNDPEHALLTLSQAQVIMEGLVKRDPDDPNLKSDLARINNQIAALMK
jgi:eukaryotic-like serine/threonine-protein kinase